MREFPGERRTAGDTYGASIAVHDDLLIIGASSRTNAGGIASGAVELYNARTGQFLAELSPGDPEPGESFGFALAVNADYLAVGAPGRSGPDGVEDRGRIYLYSMETFSLLRTIEIAPTSNGLGERFGQDLVFADNGNLLASARPYEGLTAGRIFEIEPLSANPVTVYEPPADAEFLPRTFPTAFATSEDRLVVSEVGNLGSFFDVPSVGRIYTLGDPEANGRYSLPSSTGGIGGVVRGTDGSRDFYHLTDNEIVQITDETGQLLAQLTRSSTEPSSAEFGLSLGQAGDFLAVGAPASPVPRIDGGLTFRGPGAVYLFDLTDYAEIARLQPADLTPGDLFGRRLAMNSRHLVATAPEHQTDDGQKGSVFVFSAPTVGDGSPALSGAAPQVLARGNLQPRVISIYGQNFNPVEVSNYRVHLGEGIRLSGADAEGFAPVTVISSTELTVTVSEVDLFADLGPRDVTLAYGANATDRAVLGDGITVGPFIPVTGFIDTHPCDTNGDGVIWTQELIDFADALEAGTVVGVPEAEEASYLENASTIWKHGRNYRQLPGAPKPHAWVPDPQGGVDWIAPATRSAEALDRIRLYGLPPANEYIVHYQSPSTPSKSTTVVERHPDGFYELLVPIHPTDPMDPGVVQVSFYENEFSDKVSYLKAGNLEIQPMPDAPGEFDRVYQSVTGQLRAAEAYFGEDLTNYYGQDLNAIPEALRLFVLLGELVEDPNNALSLVNYRALIHDPAFADLSLQRVVDAVLGKAGVDAFFQSLDPFSGLSAASNPSVGAERLSLSAAGLERSAGDAFGPDIKTCLGLKLATEKQALNEGARESQVAKDLNALATSVGFLGPYGAAAGAAIGTPAAIGVIIEEYIAGTYPDGESLDLSVDFPDPGFNETNCGPPAVWSMTATATSQGYSFDQAALDIIFTALSAADTAKGLFDGLKEVNQVNKVALVEDFNRGSFTKLDGESALRTSEGATVTEAAKKAGSAAQGGLIEIPSTFFGPVTMRPGECATADPKLGVFSVDPNEPAEISPVKTGSGFIVFQTKDFFTTVAEVVRPEVEESQIVLSVAKAELDPGESITITADKINIDGDQGVDWAVSAGSYSVIDDGTNGGPSQINYTAPAGVEDLLVSITATSRAIPCLAEGAQEISGDLSLKVGEPAVYALSSLTDTTCLDEGETIRYRLTNTTTDEAVAGTFRLVQGLGQLTVVDPSTFEYTASSEPQYVIVEATPVDAPSQSLRASFSTNCEESGFLLLSMLVDANLDPGGVIQLDGLMLVDQLGFGEGPPPDGYAIDFGSTFIGSGSATFAAGGGLTAFDFVGESGRGTLGSGGPPFDTVSPLTIQISGDADIAQRIDITITGSPQLNGAYFSEAPDYTYTFIQDPQDSSVTDAITIAIPFSEVD